MKWQIAVVVALLVLAVGAIGVHIALTKHTRRKNRARVLKTCAACGDDTIFVQMVAFDDAESVGKTLESCFNTAACPLRVFVGLVWVDDGSSPEGVTPTDVYMALVKPSAAPFALTDHVRMLRVPADEFVNASVARAHIMRYLFRNEKYVMSVAVPATFSRAWDSYLVRMLKAATAEAGGEPTALTTMPRAVDLLGDVKPETTAPGTFVALDDHMVFKGFAMKRNVDVPVPALAWSPQLSFCEGVPSTGHSYWHPPGEVVVVNPPERLSEPARAVVGGSLVAAGSVPTTQARLGLTTARPSAKELAAKVGSKGEYLSVLSRVDLRAHR
jgi:hypothetical protein